MNVVCIGGGHGLAVTLRACRLYARDLTAVVSVADDGSSSGALRAETGLPAMGDLRRCLTTLAAPDRRDVAAALERRYDGHPAGNLLLAGLAQQLGDIEAAVHEVGALLGLAATVLPATTTAVDLVGELADGSSVRGQVAVESSRGLVGVGLDPGDPRAPVAAEAAIAAADQVVLGPGSLYGSVLAAVSPALREAVAKSDARVVFVCNLRAREPETAGYDAAAHVEALHRHGVEPDAVVCHTSCDTSRLAGLDVVVTEVARADGLVHDPERLAAALRTLVGSPA